MIPRIFLLGFLAAVTAVNIAATPFKVKVKKKAAVDPQAVQILKDRNGKVIGKVEVKS